MEKRTILALVLSAVVLFGFQLYMAKHYPPAELPNEPQAGGGAQVSEPPPALQVEETVSSIQEPAERKASSIPLKDVEIETEKYIVTLSNEGGYIKSIALKEYPDPTTKEIFRLIDIAAPEEGIFNMEGLGERGLPKTRYFTKENYKEVIFSARLDSGLDITKKYIFHDALYHIELEVYLRNSSTYPLQADYSIVAASNIDIASRIDRRYAQIVSNLSGEPRRDNGRKGDGQFEEGIVNYTGVQNKYFSAIVKTSTPTKGVLLKQIEGDNLLSALKIDEFSINPNSSVSHNFLLYAGPSKEEIMKEYDLEGAVSYGFFGGISKLLLAGLKLFQRIFRNWGIAVILLAACVNLMLFPLSRKSHESMKKVQELQPHMERLRNEHKDNPHKLNKEMMELYKKYNVNPMGGCLPLLLQMPIFIALYQALMRSLELRGARFLWIKDLSMPDAVSLPFTMPLLGNSINLLPIFMAAAMVFQQKVAMRKNASTNSPQAKQQQQMMIMMPVLFLFIMYNFPSGLVLYWLTNTVLTMFEQRAIMRA
jgi:YidC/Oxa1 family membrane protein insertase